MLLANGGPDSKQGVSRGWVCEETCVCVCVWVGGHGDKDRGGEHRAGKLRERPAVAGSLSWPQGNLRDKCRDLIGKGT